MSCQSDGIIKFYKTDDDKIIDKFVEYGIGDEETWQFFPLDLLKKEYARFKFNK